MIRDKDLDFFRPYWRRIAVTLVCACWAATEFMIFGSPFWGIIAAACAVYCYYRLFLTYPNPKDTSKHS